VTATVSAQRRPDAPADRGMLEAVTAGDAARVLSLIAEGVSPLGVDDRRNSLLHIAVWNHDVEVAKTLIAHGHPVDILGFENRTPLHAAALIHAEACCRLLLDAGAAVEPEAWERQRPLHWAALAGSPKICKLLLERGARPDVRDSRGETPLINAVRNRHVHAARVLLEHGAVVNLGEYTGSVPLKEAIDNGDVAMCELLVAHGADMRRNFNAERPSSTFDTALHRASIVAVVEVGKALVRAGMESSYVPDAPPKGYLTPFQFVVNAGNLDYVAFFVEECGEDLDQITADGRTVWELAKGDDALIGLLHSLRTDAALKAAMAPELVESSRAKSAGMGPL
jgi:ankyrin repeat protein